MAESPTNHGRQNQPAEFGDTCPRPPTCSAVKDHYKGAYCRVAAIPPRQGSGDSVIVFQGAFKEPSRSLFQYLDVIVMARGTIYNIFFRKNYAMLATVFTAAFAFEIGYNTAMNKLWDRLNKGRQWKDIRHKYIDSGE